MKSEDPNRLEIKKSDIQHHLSQEQQTFNRLTQRIRNLQKREAEDEARLETILDNYTKVLFPVLNLSTDHKIKLVQLMDEKIELQKLPKKLNQDVTDLIVQLLDEIIHERTIEEEIRLLYNKYNGIIEDEEKTDDHDDEIEDEEELRIMTEMFCFMVFKETGNRVDPEFFLKDNPDSDLLHDRFNDYLNSIHGEKKERKKTKKQIEREEEEKEKDKLKGQSLRTIYVGLAKILHPDTESDPIIKIEKEEYMKHVTHAYDTKNLSELLKLELQWVSNHSENMNNTPDETLKYFIMLLRDQIKELERMPPVSIRPRYHKIQDYTGLTEKTAARRIELDRRRYENNNRILSGLILEMQVETKLKPVFKSCVDTLLADEDDFFFDEALFNRIIMGR